MQQSLTRDADDGYHTLGEQDRQAARATLDWLPIDSFSGSFTLSGSRDRGEPQAPQAIAIDTQNPFFGDLFLAPQIANHPLVPRNTDDNRVADWATARGPHRMPGETIRWSNDETQWMGTARADWDVRDDLRLTVLGGVIDFEIDDAFIPENGFSIVNVERLLNASVEAGSVEARVSGVWADDNAWVVGAFLSRDEVEQIDVLFVDTNSAVFPSEISPSLPPGIGDTISIIGNQDADTVAVFGNTDWALSPSWKLSFGLRYTQEERRYSGCSADGPDARGVAGFPATFTAVSLSRGGLGGGGANECFTLNPKQNNSNGSLITPDVLDEDNVSGRVALN